jgi:GTP-binding protein
LFFFLVEANAGLTKADKQICRFILDKGKGLVFIINKIDLTENSREVVKEYFYSNVDLFDDALLHEPVSMNSVISGFPNKIFELALEIFRNSNKNINSKFLNIVIQNLVLKNRIPISNKYRPKIKFIKQVSTSPMIFKVFGSQLNKISHDYKRYLCKGILKKTNIKGVRVFLKFISAKNPYVAN